MKLKNMGLSLAVTSALSLGFTGCGSSSSDVPATTTQTTETGTFVDAPVQGLKYTTATQSGYTDENGSFKYVAGETVEFKLGNLSLGTKAGSTLMTPYTLGDSNTTNPSAKTTNIAMLLQSLDANRSNGNILDLSKLKDFNFTDINLTSTANDMENTVIPNMVSAITSHANFGASFLDSNTTAVNGTNANKTMKTYFESEIKFTSSNLDEKQLYMIHQEQDGSTKYYELKFTDTQRITKEYDNNGNLLVNISEQYKILDDGSIDVGIEDNFKRLEIKSDKWIVLCTCDDNDDGIKENSATHEWLFIKPTDFPQ